MYPLKSSLGVVDGFGPDYDDSFQSILVGTLFGYHVQIVEDMNGDSFDEVLISEPYNSSNSFQSETFGTSLATIVD